MCNGYRSLSSCFLPLVAIFLSYCNGSLQAEDPPIAAIAPTHPGALVGEDAQQAADLQKAIDQLGTKEGVAQAVARALELLSLRQARQGEEHWETVDAVWQVRGLELLAAKGEAGIVAGTQMQNAVILATTFQETGKYSAAQPLFQRALDLCFELFGEKHPVTAAHASLLARNLDAQGKPEEAHILHQKALSVRVELLGEKHPETATSYADLAANLVQRGGGPEAQALAQKALDLRIEVLGKEAHETANSYHVLATCLWARGWYDEAQACVQEAINLEIEVLGDKHPDTVASYNSLAGYLDAQGKYVEAEALYKKALDLNLELFGEGHPNIAIVRNNLALSLYHQGKCVEAQPLFDTSLELCLEVFGKDHPNTVTSISNIALNLAGQKRYAEAQTVAQKALDLNLALLGERHSSTALIYHNLACYMAPQGKQAEAQSAFEKSLDLRRELFGEKHPDTALSYSSVAGPLIVQAKYAEAVERLVQAVASFDAARLKVAARGHERAIFGAQQSPHELLAAMQARLDLPTAAWTAAETGLARGLSDELRSRGGVLSASELELQRKLNAQLTQLDARILQLVACQTPDDAERDELARLQSDRSSVDSQLAELAVTLNGRELAPLSVVQSAIPPDAALVMWVDVSSDGGVQEHWGCVLRSTGDPAWERLSGAGVDGTWTEDDIALPTALRAALASGNSAIQEVDALAKALYAQRVAPLARHFHGVKSLYVVATNVMAGIPAEVLTRHYTISYVPSGTFLARLQEKKQPAGLSLLALGDAIFDRSLSKRDNAKPLPPGGLLITMVAPDSVASAARLQAGDVLLRYAGVELTSVERLAEVMGEQMEARSVPITIWSEGAEITRDVPPGRLGIALHKDPAPQALANRRQTAAMLVALRGGDRQELPGTRVEVTQLAKLCGNDSRVLLDSAASEQSLDDLRKSGDLLKFRYLHFATHGEANDVNAMESVLILAQDNLPEMLLTRPGEPLINGQLSAHEVLEFWNLDAELVTLSACETALGREGGGDGLLGFSQAFLAAGSRAVCLTLWKVDDTATALLMRRFYENLLGTREGLDQPMGKAAALEEAKRWLQRLSADEALTLTALATDGVVRGARGKGERMELAVPEPKGEQSMTKDVEPFAHPRYWAPFILIGDPN